MSLDIIEQKRREFRRHIREAFAIWWDMGEILSGRSMPTILACTDDFMVEVRGIVNKLIQNQQCPHWEGDRCQCRGIVYPSQKNDHVPDGQSDQNKKGGEEKNGN